MKPVKSIIASIWVVRVIMLILCVAVFFIPLMAQGYSILANGDKNITLPMMVGFYFLFLPSLGTMTVLHILLNNIKKGDMFVVKNIKCLTIICIGLFLVGIICAVIGLISWIFAFISIAFLFVGLILLVVRNVFSHAVELKQENDFTI